MTAAPRPEHAQHIQFEGCDCIVVSPEDYEELWNALQSATAATPANARAVAEKPKRRSDDAVTSMATLLRAWAHNESGKPQVAFGSNGPNPYLVDLLKDAADELDYAYATTLPEAPQPASAAKGGIPDIIRGSTWKNPELRESAAKLVEIILRECADPIATVVDNNQPGTQNIIETAPGVTLLVGTKLYAAPLSETPAQPWEWLAYAKLGAVRDKMRPEHVEVVQDFIGPIPNGNEEKGK